jgi:ankyrin repeat protein
VSFANRIVIPLAALLACASSFAASFETTAASPVADAAMRRDTASLRSLLSHGADVNAPQADGTTALHWAAHWNDLEAAGLLIRAGAKAQIANRLGATPMMLAAENGNAAMIATLLKAGADVNAPVLSHGETALMMAARSGNMDAVKLLLDSGAQENSAENLRGTTALMWAAEQSHPDVIALLLERGADVAARSKVLRPIKRAGLGFARPNPDGSRPLADPTGGVSALHLAVRQGCADCVRVLIQKGAPVNQASADGSTPLIVAVQNGQYPIAQFLLDHGANPNLANAKGWTPLYLAVKNRNAENTAVPPPPSEGALAFIQARLDRGADPNVRIAADTEVHQGMTSLWLREAGATPLLRAALCGDLTVVKLLLAHGADPSIPTFDHTTPLMAASGVGWSEGMLREYSEDQTLEVIRILLDRGADVNAANDHGITALHGAAYKGANKAVMLLVEHGADLSAKDKGEDYGFGVSSVRMTPLNWAEGVPIGMSSAIFHDDTVKLLAGLMKERGIPVVYHSFSGQKSSDTPVLGEGR